MESNILSIPFQLQGFRLRPTQVLPGLVEVVRETQPQGAELAFLCFNQLKDTFFKYLARGTLSGWVHRLNISKHRCTELEQLTLKTLVPDQKGKPFFLVLPEDGLKLLHYHQDRLRDVCARASSYQRNQWFTGGLIKPPAYVAGPAVPGPVVITESLHASTATRTSKVDQPAAAGPSTTSQSVQYDEPSINSDRDLGEDENEDEDEDDGEGTSDDGPSTSRRSPRKLADTLPLEAMSPSLRQEFRDFARFYGREYESRRKGCKLSECTIEKVAERLRSFFAFVKNSQKLEPQFSQCANASIVEEYANYLSESRQLRSVTIARHLYAVEKALRFHFRNGPPGRLLASAALDTIRNVRGQCERIDRVRKLNEQEGIGCEKKLKVVYAEILQLCRDLVSAFEEESNSLRKARTLHDLVLVLTYLYYAPRAQEIRTLTLLEGLPAGETVHIGPPNRQNVLAFYDDGSVELFVTKYKTDQCYGPAKIRVPSDTSIYFYLKLYVNNFRDKLLMGADHLFLFVNTRGEEFSGSGTFSKYLRSVVERATGKSCSTNGIRHAIATRFVGDSDWCDNESFRASLSRVMRHSRQTQERCYTDLTNAEICQEALDVLSQSAEDEIFGDCIKCPAVPADTGSPESDNEESLQPAVGDIVALVDPASQGAEPIVFIAQVMRFSRSRTEAILAEFAEVEEGLPTENSKQTTVDGIRGQLDLASGH